MCAVVPLRNRSPVFLPAVATLATLKISHQLPTGGTIVQHESHRPAANSGLKNGPLTYRSRATDRTACVHRNTSWCRSHNNNNVLQVSASRQHSSATVLPLPPPLAAYQKLVGMLSELRGTVEDVGSHTPIVLLVMVPVGRKATCATLVQRGAKLRTREIIRILCSCLV